MTNSKDIFNALKSGKLSVEDAQRELKKNKQESFQGKSLEVAENFLFFGKENKNKSDRDRIFSNLYKITIENNICLREHIVYNQYIMPTYAFIEMIYVGAKKLLGLSCIELEKIHIANPLIGFKGQTIIADLTFTKIDNSYRFVISSKYADSTDEFMQNVRGIIREIPLTLSKNIEYKSYISDYDDLIKGSISNAELGPFYQAIKEIKIKNDVAISHLELPSAGKKLKADFLMNPSIADGAILTSLIFAGFLSGDHKQNVFLPVQIESLQLYKEIEKDAYFCFVQLKEIKPEWTVFDVELIDEQHDEVVLSFKDLKVKNFDRSMIDRSVEMQQKKFNTKIMKKTFIENNTDSYKKYNKANRDIAVIGISCKFPDADNTEEFWHNLAQGKDSVREVPKDRWDIDEYFDPDPDVPNKTYCKWGGFLKEIDKFDPLFFNISPFEATFMDPQQRLFLQESWKAIEDAGYSPDALSGKKCGMFVGVGTGDYQNLPQEINAHYFMGISNSILSARLSYFLNLTGTALPIDTACSSSLVAIHQGCQSILSGENEMALAGGVHIMTTPLLYIMAGKAGMLSYTGKCRTFDNQADGFVPGEGVGVLVLKPLKKAVKDGDNIYGVIKGSGTNQDGKTNGITAPSRNSQIRLEKELYDKCGISPETISFVETHGTGTKLGDPIELAALRESFKAYTAKKHFCSLGSVKTNIGHTATAAGVASVIKVLLSLKHKKIPPSLNFEKANEHINFQDSPFYVNTKLSNWKGADDAPLRAAVSSFGFSGTNAHVVLEEYPEKLRITNYELRAEEPQLFVLSARNEERLKVYTQNMVDFLEKSEKPVAADNKNIIELIEKEILKVGSQIIDVSESDINKAMPFTEYGFDMVQLSLLHEEFNKLYGIQSKAGIFSESASVESVASELYENYKNAFDVHFQAVSSQPSAVSHQPSDFSLADMVYTLQIGRKAMEHRLAFVVQDQDELVSGLKDFCDGKKVENLYIGNVKKDKAKSEFLLEGKEGREFIRVIIEEKKLSKLAWLWITGVEIDWNLLYSQEKPRRISLPTYPFKKERYWVSSVDSSQLLVDSSRLTVDSSQRSSACGYGEMLHPLVHRNTSTLQEQKFTSYFIGKEFYFADHVVFGKKFLPGVAYIEMARAAGKLAGLENIKSIKNIVWMQPVIVEEDQVQEVNISLYPNEDIIEYEVFIAGEDGQRLICSQGKLFQGHTGTKGQRHKGAEAQRHRGTEAQSVEEAGLVDIEVIKSRCTKTKDRKKLYASFKKAGIEYGTGFQAIQELYYNENEALSYLKIPKHLKDDFNGFVLHPSLMDSALQTTIGFMKGKESAELLLPFSLDSAEIINPLIHECCAYVKTKKTGTVKTFDVQILDTSGNILVNMNGFSARAYQAHAQATEPSIDTYQEDEDISDLFQKLENGKLSSDEVYELLAISH